ncbi:MAG: hypothetical protein MZV63_55830 [Marinilabiliales bacterium]|nr:hypothetical protein [Marinilabiliales bacterium]
MRVAAVAGQDREHPGAQHVGFRRRIGAGVGKRRAFEPARPQPRQVEKLDEVGQLPHRRGRTVRGPAHLHPTGHGLHPGARQKHFFALRHLQLRLTHRVIPPSHPKPVACLNSRAARSVATEVFRINAAGSSPRLCRESPLTPWRASTLGAAPGMGLSSPASASRRGWGLGRRPRVCRADCAAGYFAGLGGRRADFAALRVGWWRRLGGTQGRAVDADGDAAMLEAVEQCIDQGFVGEQLVPGGGLQIRGDDGRDAAVALIHQAEEGVGPARV